MSIMTSFPTADISAIRTYITRRKGIRLVVMMAAVCCDGNRESVMCSNRVICKALHYDFIATFEADRKTTAHCYYAQQDL